VHRESLLELAIIARRVKTGLDSATYAEVFAFADTICEDKKTWKRIDSSFIMILDKKSEEDRRVMLINGSLRKFYPEDESLNI
jgi:hypothetical protein